MVTRRPWGVLNEIARICEYGQLIMSASFVIDKKSALTDFSQSRFGFLRGYKDFARLAAETRSDDFHLFHRVNQAGGACVTDAETSLYA